MSVGSRVRPRKSLGQHWLHDRTVLERIAGAADFSDSDTVIEVGAGTGLLTEMLARRAKRLIAIEVDERLGSGLRREFAGRENVAVLHTDVLETPIEELLAQGDGGLPYVVVGNLPYFIGTAIVRRFLYAPTQPRWLIVTLQAEVAESMTAGPGRMTSLAVQTQLVATARILFYIEAKSFTPPPKVRSAVVRLDLLDTLEFEVDDRDAFLELVQAGFAAPRKRIRNSLAIGLHLPAAATGALLVDAGLDPAQRPADLTLGGWKDLYFAFRAASRREGP